MLELIKSKFSSAEADAPRNDEPAKTAQDTPGREVWLDQVAVAVGAVDESSKLTRALFTYFLTASAYVAIAVLGTSQETLLLNAGIELPIIGTQVPVIEFYILAPAILVAFHLNLLVKLWSLKKKAEEQARQLAERFDGDNGEAVHAFRHLLYPYDFTMIVAGPTDRNILRGAMALIITLTVFLGPLALLFATMQSFAPVGINWMTKLHGTLILIDALFLVVFRLGLRRPTNVYSTIDAGVQAFVLLMIGTLGLTIATFRTSLYDKAPYAEDPVENTGSQRIELRVNNPWRLSSSERQEDGHNRKRAVLRLALPQIDDDTTYCLINPSVAPSICLDLRSGAIANDTHSFFSEDELAGRRRLSDVTAQLCSAASGRFATQLDLSGRQLRYAQLRNAVAPCVLLKDADLTEADLFSAHLSGAKLPFANLTNADLTLADLSETDLTNVTFSGTDLRGVDLSGAYLGVQGMSLSEAPQLANASLTAANLSGSMLVGANLFNADMRSTTLVGTNLMRSTLIEAQLHFADLVNANLFGARMRDAVLDRSYISGTDLRNAQLHNAQFSRSRIVASDLENSNMSGANLRNTLLFGIDISEAIASGVLWPMSISSSQHLLFADNACFAPLISAEDESERRNSLCIPAYTGRRHGLDNDEEQTSLELYNAKGVTVTTAAMDQFEKFMKNAACVLDREQQPIGLDGKPMDLKPCYHEEFRERMEIHACGYVKRTGAPYFVMPTNMEGYYQQPPISEFMTASDARCKQVGLGTSKEPEWLDDRFIGSRGTRPKLDYTGSRIPP
ncbi:MAG: pentapeptide repeat-containing protein [Pseudomonadota bacterium]